MKHVVQLVDSTQYVNTNCFQHQLLDGLRRACKLTTVDLTTALATGIPSSDEVVSCLRLRTLNREISGISRALGTRSIVVYDQDPWESFKHTGTCNGAYTRIAGALNVRTFAVTTYAWEARLARLGFPATFVRMGMLPKYCSADPRWSDRDVDVGFIGQLHPYRVELFDSLRAVGLNVRVMSGGDYRRYVDALSRIKVFVHRESGEYDVNGETIQYAEGLWAKDVEACARGCVSVRNWHPDAYRHMPEYLIGNGLRMFSDDSIDEAVNVIKGALDEANHSPEDCAEERRQCAEAVSWSDDWHVTACILINEHGDESGVEKA